MAKTPTPRRYLTLTWTKAGVFFVLGLWPALLILYNLRPVLTLAQQLQRYQGDLNFEGAFDRFKSLAGADLPKIGAVKDATRAVNDGAWDADRFARLRQADADNAVVAYLEAAARLAAAGAGGTDDDDALTRFGAIGGVLDDARAAPHCDWHTAATMRAWNLALADSGARADLNARLARDWACRGKARAIRTTCGVLGELADELLAASQIEPARTCVEAAADFARRSLDGVVSADVAVASAEQLAGAYRRRGLLAAAEQRWPEADRAAAQAAKARRFCEILRRRRAAAPYDPILQISVPREQPYRFVVSYLLASGVLIAGWAALFAVGLVAFVAAVVRRVMSGSAGEPATVGPGWIHWLRAGAIVAGPCAALAAAVLLVPIDLASTMSQNWIQPAIILGVVLTIASVLTLARGRASAGRTPPGSSRVWQAWWVAVGLLSVLVLFRPWMPFGADAGLFDLGLRPPQAPARAQATQALAVILGALGGLVWLAWCLTAWLKGRKKGPGGVTGTGGPGLGRTTLALAVWGWLILGMMSLGPARLYHRYDARLQELTVHDLQDEVTAWMGPAWKGVFFQAPG